MGLMTLLSAVVVASVLAVGDPLPALKGEFLTGRKAELPEAASGKVTLVALGFTYDSRWAVEAWVKRFREEFGERQDVAFFEVPVIGGMARLGKWFIDSGMRRGTPKTDHERVITVYGGTGEWKRRLRYRNENDAYLVLLRPDGGIAWLHNGPFDEAAWQRLAAAVAELGAK
jgi:hypothetical protein